LSDQTHPDDGDTLTQTEISLAETMQRDGTQCRERSVYQVDTLWNRDAQIRRHSKDLGVRRLFAAAGNEITGTDVANLSPDSLHAPRRAVPERRDGFEPASNRTDRRAESLGTNFIDDLTHLIRPAPRFSEQALPSDLHLGPLSAGADERGAGSDEHLPLIELRRRNVKDAKLAVLHPLPELLHLASSCTTDGVRSWICSRRESPEARCAHCRLYGLFPAAPRPRPDGSCAAPMTFSADEFKYAPSGLLRAGVIRLGIARTAFMA
jgi:hypothetical protein